jgi:hypothetical protein
LTASGFVIAHESCGDGAPRPFGNSYWLWTGRVLAGEHPGLLGTEAMAERLAALAEAGITHFVDLTSPHDPVPPYQPLPLTPSGPVAATAPPAQRLSHPITDFGVPTVASMQAILNDVQNALDQGGKVYLHCRAGIGRTGTVAATWLVAQGLPPEQALGLLAQKWCAVDKHAQEPHSPETEAQRVFVRHWPAPGL